MKLTIERATLLKALGHVQSVVERRNTIPILGNVLIEAAAGRLTLSATDLDIQIVESVEAEIETPGATTVAAGTLHDIVRKLPEGAQVSIAVAERMVVTAARSRFQLNVLPADDFPRIATGEMAHSVSISTAVMRDVIDRTRYAVSTEETRFYLNGIFMHVSEAGLQAVATDGHRLARNRIDAGESPLAGMPDVILPRKAVAELAKIVGEYDGDVEIGLSRSKATFEIGDVLLVTKAIDGTFPDYTRVIPQANGIMVTVDTRTLADAVERVSTIASEKTRAIKVDIAADAMTVSVTSPENGTAVEEIPCASSGAVQIGFNARYLIDILAKFGDSTEIRLADGAAPALFVNAEHPDDVAVLMPMRV